MGIESDHSRRRIDKECTLDDRPDDLLMTKVKSIEDSQSQHRWMSYPVVICASDNFHPCNRLKIYAQPIISEFDPIRERKARFFMFYIVTDMRQECPSGFEFRDISEGLIEMQVGRVRIVAQRIDNQ